MRWRTLPVIERCHTGFGPTAARSYRGTTPTFFCASRRLLWQVDMVAVHAGVEKGKSSGAVPVVVQERPGEFFAQCCVCCFCFVLVMSCVSFLVAEILIDGTQLEVTGQGRNPTAHDQKRGELDNLVSLSFTFEGINDIETKVEFGLQNYCCCSSARGSQNG